METNEEMQEETETPAMARAETPATSSEVKTVEHWAAKHGHLPHFHPGKPPAEKPTKVMPKVWNPHYQKFVAAKHMHTWPVGMEMTEADYVKAVEAVAKHVYR